MLGIKKIKVNNKSANAFTMVETLVVVAIFALLVVSATDIFLSIIRSQRNTLFSKNAQEAVNYALEVINKELRMAKIDDGMCGEAEKVYSVSGNQNRVHFRNYLDQCVVYFLEESTGRLIIERDGASAYMTPDTVIISNLKFKVVNNDIKNQQPIITIQFVLSYLNVETGQQSIAIQTSVSSRFYENYELNH